MRKLAFLSLVILLFSFPALAEETLSENAVALYNVNNNDAAMEVLLKIDETERTPQDWLLLGNILMDLNRNSDAVFMYQRAIVVDSKFYKAYYNLGTLYLEDERFYVAIENFKKAIKYKPDFAYGHYNLGCAYIKIGEIKKARREFVKAIDLKNTVPEFHYNLAYVYKKMNKKKLADSYLNNYNKLISDNLSD